MANKPGATPQMSWLELAWIVAGAVAVAAALTVGFVLVTQMLGPF